MFRTVSSDMRKNRRQEYAESTRRAILDAARDAFRQHGFAHASLDAIGDAARVTKGALYHHFDSKQQLFEAVVEEVEAEMLARVRTAVARKKDRWSRLEAGFSAFFDACLDENYRRIAIEEGPAALGWAKWRNLGDGAARKQVTTVVAEMMAAGVMRRHPPDLLARVLLSIVIELGFAVADAEDRAMAKKEADAIMRSFLTPLRVK